MFANHIIIKGVICQKRPCMFARGLLTKEPSLLLRQYGLVTWHICEKVALCQTWVLHERVLNEVQAHCVVFLCVCVFTEMVYMWVTQERSVGGEKSGPTGLASIRLLFVFTVSLSSG